MMLRQRTKWFTFAMIVIMLFIAVTPVTAAPKDTVRVWVSYQSGKKAEVFQALDKAKGQFHYDFPELEAYVVTLPEAALNGIIHNPFVTDVEEDPVRYAIDPVEVAVAPGPDDTVDVNGQVVPWGIDAVQARDVWDTDRDAVVDDGAPDGSGITVCIIDTGYYADHEDLIDLTTGLSQVDDDYTRDGEGHGSHVAGTISALNNNIGVVGVTPGTVNLTIVKIFNDDGVWTSASNLVNAIYTCRDNGADIISMSLGGASSSRKEQRAFDTLYSQGILSIAAAGNEQQETPGAYEYPGSYDSVMSVAAVDSSLAIGDFSQQNDQVEIAAPGVGVLSTIPYVDTNLVNVAGVDYTANHIEYSALGTASGAFVDGGLCTTTGAWSGQVVLCSRGDISFYDKVMNVQNSGGVAAVIYNNEPGNFLGTLGDGSSSSIIGVSLSQEDGQYLVANQLGTVATITSTHDWPTSGYEAWGGTSMATPHVSGVAALIWSANPSWTNVEIREAMNATAIDLGAAGRDSVFGYGLVQAAAALEYLQGGVTPPPPPPPTGALSAEIVAPAEGTVFANRQTATVQVAVVDDNSDPVAGASVSVVVTGSTGKTVSLSGTTGADGIASMSFKINAGKTGYGTYLVNATASLDGYDDGTASSTFIVQ
ncbi:MAG: S8 family serine peptidase [Anaerolineaceae bacterium]|nr:S8 family serine peptidase [Anaerolineaceae bacterium]